MLVLGCSSCFRFVIVSAILVDRAWPTLINQDVIEMRERKWSSRKAIVAPTTIAQVHEAVC